MLLRNVFIVGGRDSSGKDVLLANDQILAVTETGNQPFIPGETINFDSAIVFPGLINSHDHLDFNLFPQLGNRTYASYTEWGDDIHAQNKQQINAVLQVPQSFRIRWGMYKNLLNGFTTVVNHGDKLPVTDELVTVHQQCVSLHSAAFEKRWKWKLNRPRFSKDPFVIHTGEGTDGPSLNEIDALIRWNLFKKKIIGVHGVAMLPKQAAAFHALVWCPESNYFLLNKTAQINLLKKETTVLFGTDSTLTAAWNAWAHLRSAKQTGLMADTELLQAVTLAAARSWGFEKKAEIVQGYRADIVVARKKNRSVLGSFFMINPEDILLVIHKGQIMHFDESIFDQLKDVVQVDRFSKIKINTSLKFVSGDLPGLMKEIRDYYPGADLSPIQSCL